MKRSGTYNLFLDRRFIAAAVLCLFVLKGLLLMGMTASLASDPLSADQTVISSVLGMHCENSQSNTNRSNHHTNHIDCCVLCSSAERNASLLSVAIFAQVVEILAPEETSYSLDRLFKNDSLPARALWRAYSWSATAPPHA